MGEVRFGKNEKLECIAEVRLLGGSDEPLCLAHKISTYWFLAGVHLSDDGYVLKIAGEEAYFPMPSAAELAEFQAAGVLPSPLPAYKISTSDYLAGYSLWLIVGAVLLFSAVHTLGRKLLVLLGFVKGPESTGALSYGPPVLKTASDRFVYEQVSRVLRPGEQVQHQAYTLDRSLASGSVFSAVTAKGFFAVLTDQRLLLVKTRVGAFTPLLENHGIEVIEREDIREVTVEHDALTFYLTDGSVRTLAVQNTSKLSNQRAFFRDVPRLLAAVPSSEAFAVELEQRA